MISGKEAAMTHATSIARSRPRRAAAAFSTIQQGVVAQRHRGATGTSSRAAEKSTASLSDPYLSIHPDGEGIYERRSLPKFLLKLT
jgi:hypothetical protein